MSKLVMFWNDETRVFIESTYTQDPTLKLMKQSSFEDKPTELGEFRLASGKLLLVLAKDSPLQVVISKLEPVKVEKDDEIPF